MTRPTDEELANAKLAYDTARAVSDTAKAAEKSAYESWRDLAGRAASADLAEKGIVVGKTVVSYEHGWRKKTERRAVVIAVAMRGPDPSVGLLRLRKDGSLSNLGIDWNYMDGFLRRLKDGYYTRQPDYVAPEATE